MIGRDPAYWNLSELVLVYHVQHRFSQHLYSRITFASLAPSSYVLTRASNQSQDTTYLVVSDFDIVKEIHLHKNHTWAYLFSDPRDHVAIRADILAYAFGKADNCSKQTTTHQSHLIIPQLCDSVVFFGYLYHRKITIVQII